jgi:hypothetical protein
MESRVLGFTDLRNGEHAGSLQSKLKRKIRRLKLEESQTAGESKTNTGLSERGSILATTIRELW